MANASTSSQLVVVANRLPFRRVITNGETTWITSPGGLVAALAPSLADVEQMAWVGWAGDLDDKDGAEAGSAITVDGMHLTQVPMSSSEKRLHYDGMSNGTLIVRRRLAGTRGAGIAPCWTTSPSAVTFQESTR